MMFKQLSMKSIEDGPGRIVFVVKIQGFEMTGDIAANDGKAPYGRIGKGLKNGPIAHDFRLVSFPM
ncbi:hypothetical protein GCM10011511_15020 [Puia dinghuensis]|uniref:Uncharacterized protein n=1 Tax=Puia dinghuensis TaxID=1792502 RepID=A0A8J2UBH9_9BACT|nr:hypothetical protein GCM10011511_15020 [Puia dinghuensis]